MPFYEFNCKEHGDFENYQSIFEGKEALCPQCKSVSKRILSIPTIMGNLPTLNRNKGDEARRRMAATSVGAK